MPIKLQSQGLQLYQKQTPGQVLSREFYQKQTPGQVLSREF